MAALWLPAGASNADRRAASGNPVAGTWHIIVGLGAVVLVLRLAIRALTE